MRSSIKTPRRSLFLCGDARDINALDGGTLPGWQRTGEVIPVFARRGRDSLRSAASTSNRSRDSHFFSASGAECSEVRVKFPQLSRKSAAACTWRCPNTSSGRCLAGTSPSNVSGSAARTRIIADSHQRGPARSMVASGGVAEGYGPAAVAMCAAPPDLELPRQKLSATQIDPARVGMVIIWPRQRHGGRTKPRARCRAIRFPGGTSMMVARTLTALAAACRCPARRWRRSTSHTLSATGRRLRSAFPRKNTSRCCRRPSAGQKSTGSCWTTRRHEKGGDQHAQVDRRGQGRCHHRIRITPNSDRAIERMGRPDDTR